MCNKIFTKFPIKSTPKLQKNTEKKVFCTQGASNALQPKLLRGGQKHAFTRTMPILEKMVCESLNGAIFESLNGGGGSAAAGSGSDDLHIQDKMLSTAKRLMLQSVEYEECANNSGKQQQMQTTTTAVKTKCIVLKSPGGSAGVAANAVTNGGGHKVNGSASNGELKVNGAGKSSRISSRPLTEGRHYFLASRAKLLIVSSCLYICFFFSSQ